MAFIGQMTSDIATNLAAKFDACISTAVKQQTGCVLTLLEIASRGRMNVWPDGVEVFQFDGRDLVQFWPLEFETIHGVDAVTVRASRRYQILNDTQRREPSG